MLIFFFFCWKRNRSSSIEILSENIWRSKIASWSVLNSYTVFDNWLREKKNKIKISLKWGKNKLHPSQTRCSIVVTLKNYWCDNGAHTQKMWWHWKLNAITITIVHTHALYFLIVRSRNKKKFSKLHRCGLFFSTQSNHFNCS